MERQSVFLGENFKEMTSDWDELSEPKRQNSKAIIISRKNSPIKRVDLNGKTPFSNKIGVKLFFRLTKQNCVFLNILSLFWETMF